MTSDVIFQLATEKDLPRLLELMRELYQHEGMMFDEEVARSGLNKTLVDPTVGSVYLILADQELAGYLALTFCFSLEFYGKCGLLDELYVREAFRGRKLGKVAVEFAESICRKTGIPGAAPGGGREKQSGAVALRFSGLQT